MPFRKGQSGNSQGRPLGSLNKRTQALRMLIGDEAEALIKKAVEKAKEGDIHALKLCLERILPPIKDDALNIGQLKVGKSAASILTLSRQIIKAVSQGEITPSQGETLMSMIERYGKAIDLKDLEERILDLEEAVTKKEGGKLS